MSSQVTLPVLGLATDMSPTVAPKGALSAADHVVCDLPGLVRGRPNSAIIAEEAGPTERPTCVFAFDGEWFAWDADEGWRNATGLVVGPDAGGPLIAELSEQQVEQARGSTYVTTIDGVLKVVSPTTLVMPWAGLEMNVSPNPYTAPTVAFDGLGPFTSPFTVGYRIVIKRTDANGYVLRSAPSALFVPFDIGSAVDESVALAYPAPFPPIPSDGTWTFQPGVLLENDVVEFYRTRIVTTGANGPLAPDMYLAASYTVTLADVTAGNFPQATSVIDRSEDSQLGQALYTNPGQGGALAARLAPPRVSALALFASCMWYGMGYDRERLVLQLTKVGSTSSRDSDGVSLGATAISTGTITVATDTITGVASVTGLRVGQYLSRNTVGPESSLGEIPAETTIIAITGAGPYTVQMSANATGNHANSGPSPTIASDSVTIDGLNGEVVFFAYNTVSATSTRAFEVDSSLDAAARSSSTAYSFALVVNRYTSLNGDGFRIVGPNPVQSTGALTGEVGTLIIESDQPRNGLIDVTSLSAPDAFTPSIRKPAQPDQTLHGNRLWWSLPDEPEAVPLLNFTDIGDSRGRIQRLVPLRDAMLVFKEDGLWRVTGSAPDRWTVDLLDATLRLVRSECVDTMEGIAYAFTNRGLVAVSESGVRNTPSDNKVGGQLEGTIRAINDDPTQRGCRVLCWERRNLVLVFLPRITTGGTLSQNVMCFSPVTGGWTRWPELYFSAACTTGPTGYPIVAASRNDNLPIWELRSFDDESRGYDHVYEGVVVGTDNTTSITVTDVDRGSWLPAVGDWLSFHPVLPYWRRVLSVSYDGGTETWTLVLDGIATAGEGADTTPDVYEGAPVQLEWMPSATESAAPFSLPVWREVAFAFANGPATSPPTNDARLIFGVRHDVSAIILEIVVTPERSEVAMRPYRIGWPREAARRAVAWVRLGFSEIDWPWQITGVSMVGQGGSEKVRQ